MKGLNPIFMFLTAFKSMGKNFTLTTASILILTACLVLSGSFYLLMININTNIEELTAVNQIVVFIDFDYSSEVQLAAIENTIAEHENVVGRPEHICRYYTLQMLSERLGWDIYEILNENPYRDSFIITYANHEYMDDLVEYLENIPGIDNIIANVEIARMLDGVQSMVSIIFLSFLAVLFFVTIFIIITTIRLAVVSRREEIALMRYVGASKSFIVVPFVLEGVLIGAFSAIIAFFAQRMLYTYIEEQVILSEGILRIIPFSAQNDYILMGFLLIGILTGILGSCMSLFRHMKA